MKDLMFKKSFSLNRVQNHEIIYVQANRAYCYLHLSGGRLQRVSKPLSWIEKMLDDASFLKIHRSFLVNVSKIKSLNRIRKQIQFIDGSVLPVAIRKQKFVQESIMDLHINPSGKISNTN